MAIENVQCVKNHLLLYRRAIKPVINYFIEGTKEQQIETTKQSQLNFGRKRCRSRKALFRPSKYVRMSLT